MVGQPQTAYRLRPCTNADASAIVGLFQRSFKTAYDLETWRWKYQLSPWARPELSVVAELASGEIVGHVGAMLHPINLLGRPQLAAQCCDFMIDERHRSRGPFRELFETQMKSIAETGIKVCLGFPNENSLPAMHLAGRLVAIMEKYHLRLGSDQHARLRERVEAVPERARFRFEFNPDYALDARYDAVWRSCSKLESLSVWKDCDYMEWKYGSAPSRHRLFTLEFAGDVVALGACREQGKRADVLELVVRDKNIPAAQELLLFLADAYLDRGFEELRFVGQDPWFFAEVFKDFERRPTFWGHFFVRPSNRSEDFLYENPLNWTVVSGDSDS